MVGKVEGEALFKLLAPLRDCQWGERFLIQSVELFLRKFLPHVRNIFPNPDHEGLRKAELFSKPYGPTSGVYEYLGDLHSPSRSSRACLKMNVGSTHWNGYISHQQLHHLLTLSQFSLRSSVDLRSSQLLLSIPSLEK